MKKIWIVAADQFEIPNLVILLKNYPGVEFHPCGIGLFESFYNFNQSLYDCAEFPGGVILAGTAGSPGGDDLFKINYSNSFLNPAFKSEEIPEFLPQKWKTNNITENITPNFFYEFPVYSTFGISHTENNLMETMAGAWENMEALSLSYICWKKQIPFSALLCCTNQICPEGRSQWKKNFPAAGGKLLEALKIILDSFR